MAFGNGSSGYGQGRGAGRPAAAAPAAAAGTMPTHLLKMKVGEGDDSKFVTLTGLFMSGGENGKVEFLKGKTRSVVSIRMDDGTELSGNQFYIFPKEDK